MSFRNRDFHLRHTVATSAILLLLVTAAAWGCSSSPSTSTTKAPQSSTVPTTTTVAPPTTTTTAPTTTALPPTTTTSTPTTSAPPPTTTTTAPTSVTIDLVAQNMAFSLSTITVAAGAKVTVNFNNMDSQVPHNFAVYTNSSGATSIFVGSIVTGPTKTTYTFTAPTTPGNYFFRCDVHATIMTGTFIVQ